MQQDGVGVDPSWPDKGYGAHAKEYTLLPRCAESLRRNYINMLHLWMLQEHTCNCLIVANSN